MRRYALATASLFLLSACARSGPQTFDIGPAPQSGVPSDVNLTGTWIFNPDDSDRPGQGFGMPGGGRFGRGGGFGGFGSGGEGGGEMGGGEGRGEGRRGVAEVLDSTLRRPARRLVISQTDSTVTISPHDSVQYTLYFDGRNVVAPELLGGTRVGLSGHWHKKQFEVDRELPSGATVTESYQVTRHGQRLVIHVRVSRGSDEQVMPEFQIVYDLYQQSSGESPQRSE